MRIIDQRLLCFGLTPAQSGEFSARAFFNGKMDLTQVQGVNELINAENDAQIESAISMLEGHYHQHLTRGYESLNNLAGLIEASIDFSEEDIEFISCKSILEELNQLIELFEQILRDALDSKQIMTLPRVFLVGLTNSGKSTLVNRLSGLHRAIISQFSGTTRDILSVVWKHDRQELMLCDTPGLLAKSSDDSITRSAVERCLKYLPLADMILFVIDPTRSIAEQVQLFSSLNVNKDKIVYVINKSDLGQHGEPLDVDKPSFQVSGLLGNGLAELTNFVFERMKARSVTIVTGQIALDVRSRNIITETVGILRSAADETKNIMHYSTSPGIEVIASIIQSAIRSLGTLLGKDVTENVLETIFSRFCIGK
jgi:tRNA modification GTPase